MNRLRKREHVLVEHILTKDARKGAVLAGMPVGAIGAGDDEVLDHELLDVLLVHVERRDGRIALLDDLEGGVDGGLVARGRDLLERAAEDARVAGIRDEQRRRATATAEVRLHLFR